MAAGCDAVKFQKRTPELCVPKDQWEKMRETPWGTMSYIDYKRKTEFGQAEYEVIDDYCKIKGIDWFASCWDEPSVDFMEQFQPCALQNGFGLAHRQAPARPGARHRPPPDVEHRHEHPAGNYRRGELRGPRQPA